MNTTLCLSRRCWIPGAHRTDCPSEMCRGCQPNTAGAGLLLCYGCADRIGSDAIAAAEACAELAEWLAPGGTGQGRGGVNPHPSLTLHDGVVEVRNLIRSQIVAWSKLVHEQRRVRLPWEWRIVRLPAGVEGPARRVRQGLANTRSLAQLIQTHARWLAAHPAAADCAEELSDLVAAARRVTNPSGTRVIEIGPCPMEGCGGTLRGLLRRQASLIPSSVTCDTEPGHEWTSADWLALARSMKAAA